MNSSFYLLNQTQAVAVNSYMTLLYQLLLGVAGRSFLKI